MAEVRVIRSVRVGSAPEQLWPLINDTDVMNRLAGMSKIEMLPPSSSGFTRVATRLDGFPVVYVEHPFEWEAPRWFKIHREMESGATDWLEMRTDLLPLPEGGTEVRIDLALCPNIPGLGPIARVLASRRVDALLDAVRTMDRQLAEAGPGCAPVPPAGTPGATRPDAAALARAMAALVHPLAHRLGDHVATAHDADLVRIRPFELADRWGLPRRQVLEACLAAVPAGLLDMHWDLICPSCRQAGGRVEHLWQVGAEGHCGFCEIRFDLPLDQSVEAVFQPSAAVRRVEVGPFCTGGPGKAQHVLAQMNLAPRASITLHAPPETGTFQLFARGGASARLRVDHGAPPRAQVSLGQAFSEPELLLAPGAELVLRSERTTQAHVKVERLEWLQQAATAHHLGLDPAFRRDFSEEVLGPGRSMRISRVALLFSDLTASTALYTREGDAGAFKVVQDHFELLRGIIETNEGAVVKTIGDAVMAAFPSEGHAVRAGLAMQAAWPEFQRKHPSASDCFLKIGVNAGPAYCVTANRILDYFGQSVNVAARLQSAAEAGELVVSEACAKALGVDAVRRFKASLKGLEGPFECSALRGGPLPPAEAAVKDMTSGD